MDMISINGKIKDTKKYIITEKVYKIEVSIFTKYNPCILVQRNWEIILYCKKIPAHNINH